MFKFIYKKIKKLSLINKFFIFIIFPVVVGWIGTYTYGLIFPAPDEKILTGQETTHENQENIKEQIDNIRKIIEVNEKYLSAENKVEINRLLKKKKYEEINNLISFTIPILQVANEGGLWSKSVDLVDGKKVLFQIHYYVNNDDATEVELKMEDLRNQIINGSEKVLAYLYGENTFKIYDSVTINSNNKTFKLTYYRSSMRLDDCMSSFCEYTGGTSTTVFSGYNAPGLLEDHLVNLVVAFNVEEVLK